MKTELYPIPVGATGKDGTVLVNSSGNVAAATATATLAAGGANVMTFITGFEFTALGATAGSIVLLTITGVAATAPTYIINVPAGATTSIPNLIVEFPAPIPATGLNTAITVTVPTLGAGNTNTAVVAHGFQIPFSS